MGKNITVDENAICGFIAGVLASIIVGVLCTGVYNCGKAAQYLDDRDAVAEERVDVPG